MKATVNDYRTAGTPAWMRAKLYHVLEYALRGLECNTDVACNETNIDALRIYHEGKAQAFREIITFFELPDKRAKED